MKKFKCAHLFFAVHTSQNDALSDLRKVVKKSLPSTHRGEVFVPFRQA
jgi:hypothetical protein